MTEDFEWVSKKNKDNSDGSKQLAVTSIGNKTPSRINLYLNILYNYIKYLADLLIYGLAKLVHFLVKLDLGKLPFLSSILKLLTQVIAIMLFPIVLAIKYISKSKNSYKKINSFVTLQILKGVCFISVLFAIGSIFLLMEQGINLKNATSLILGLIAIVWLISRTLPLPEIKKNKKA